MERIEAIRRVALIDAVGVSALSALTRVAAYISGAAAAAVHVFHEEEQLRVAATGAPLVAHPARDSLCLSVVQGGERIICCDASAEPRFAYSSFACGSEPVRFYASLPIRREQDVVGTLCVWDTRAAELDPEQVERLEDLALQAEVQLTLGGLANMLAKAAAQDPLTGLANRSVFDDCVTQALARCERRGWHLAVVMGDIDDFKRFNDRLGHAGGDAVLRRIAERLRASTRAEETVARLGGDEFAVVCELAEAAELELLLARLHAALHPVDEPEQPSICLGGALAQPGDDGAAVIRRADEAMYAVKRRRASTLPRHPSGG